MISEKKNTETTNLFRCSFINNKHIWCNYPWFWVITFYNVSRTFCGTILILMYIGQFLTTTLYKHLLSVMLINFLFLQAESECDGCHDSVRPTHILLNIPYLSAPLVYKTASKVRTCSAFWWRIIFFFLYVTDNVCVYKDTVHEPLDREMYILEVNFVILGHYFVFRVILLSFLEIFNSIQFYI
jgi:hypothetical protein